MPDALARPAEVTSANWRQAPHNRWAFQHIRELLPTAEVAEDPERLWVLPRAGAALDSLRIAAPGRDPLRLDQWLRESAADGVSLAAQDCAPAGAGDSASAVPEQLKMIAAM